MSVFFPIILAVTGPLVITPKTDSMCHDSDSFILISTENSDLDGDRG